ncbi:MAG: SusC/RagA family TonB-linked outer membrane protein, partial [Ginsengibacter sp.]
GPDLGSNQNPVAMQYRTVNNRSKYWNILGNAYAEVDFLNNFTARTSIGINATNAYNQGFNFTQYDNKQGNNTPNNYSESSSFGSTSTWTNTLNYRNSFRKHNVKFLLGSEAIKSTGRSVSGSRTNFFSNDYNYLVLGNGTESPSNSSSGNINTLFSVFARLDYSFSDKYLLGVTARRDGSSRFGPDKRYGIFPSFSLGWRISDEDFMKNISWINDLKLRGSYGILGSQSNVDPSNQFSLYGGGYGNAYYDITGSSNSVQQGFIQTRIGNSNTGWEQNIISNVGFDATLLNNRLTINIEYYKKSVNGLLFTQPLPATVGGATYPVINIGDIQNKGFDASIGYNGRLSKDLGFAVSTNITSYKNLVVNIPNPGYFYAGGLQGLGTITINEVGKPVSAFYGYDILSLFNSDAEVASSPKQSGAGPGRFKYCDVNGDGAITPSDRTILGSPNPDFTYGVNLGLTYKRFDISAIFYGSKGNEIVNAVRSYLNFWGGYVNNKSNDLLNAWTPQNTNTTVPIIENGVNLSTAGALNSYFIENGSFLKFKSLMLGYTISETVLKKVGINNIRIYLQGTNLFTLTKYTGLDPELGGGSSAFGIDYGNYPSNEMGILFGIRASF